MSVVHGAAVIAVVFQTKLLRRPVVNPLTSPTVLPLPNPARDRHKRADRIEARVPHAGILQGACDDYTLEQLSTKS